MPALLEMVKQGPEAKPGWEAYILLVLSGWLLLIIARVLREATEWPLPISFLAGFTSLLAVRILGYMIAPLFGLTVQA
jgi:Na+-translocating ferredoxin:NAD+ oxidoreductase RnfD subunit